MAHDNYENSIKQLSIFVWLMSRFCIPCWKKFHLPKSAATTTVNYHAFECVKACVCIHSYLYLHEIDALNVRDCTSRRLIELLFKMQLLQFDEQPKIWLNAFTSNCVLHQKISLNYFATALFEHHLPLRRFLLFSISLICDSGWKRPNFFSKIHAFVSTTKTIHYVDI